MDADASEITAMRGITGKLNRAARMAMPQVAGDASLLSGTMPQPKVKDLREANAALDRLVRNDLPITICSIPLERLVMVDFSDSSLANAGGGHTQLSHIIGAADKSIH